MEQKSIQFEQLSKDEQNALNINDITVVDSIELSGSAKTIGLIKSVVYSAFAIFVFFVQIDIGGSTNIPFGHLCNFLVDVLGDGSLWLAAIALSATGILSVYGMFFARKDSKVAKYFEGDQKFYPLLYLIGGFFCTIYALYVTVDGFQAPEFIVGANTGGTIIPAIVLPGLWIIPVSCIFLPFLLNYGLVDAIGSLAEPLMRPVFKVPGYSAVNAMASFVSSCTVGILITLRQYHKGLYTKKEAVLISTGFSAVSVGCANLAIRIAGLEDYFLQVYLSSLLLLLCISAVICRIPPLSRKESIYADGHTQTKEDILAQRGNGNIFVRAITRAEKKAYISDTISNPGREVVKSVASSLSVFPKVMALLAAVGLIGLVVAHYTPVFTWLGYIFLPVLKLCGVPDAAVVASSLPTGLAEMLLPVSVMASYGEIAIQARYIVVSISICQILFFSESIVVMTSLKLPVKMYELVILFFERTLIAIPFATLLSHILF